MPIPAFTTTLQKTHIEMCRANIHGHTDSKCFLQSSICEVVIQEWTFTISLSNFYSVIFVVILPQMFFIGVHNATLCCLIYPTTGKNASLKKIKSVFFVKKVVLRGGDRNTKLHLIVHQREKKLKNSLSYKRSGAYRRYFC